MKHAQPEQSDSAVSKPYDGASMIQRELERGAFPDERLGKRLGRLLDQFADSTAASVSDRPGFQLPTFLQIWR